jgi:hypothetical protein
LRCWAEIEIDARNEKTAKNKENREWKKEIQTFFAEINGQTFVCLMMFFTYSEEEEEEEVEEQEEE